MHVYSSMKFLRIIGSSAGFQCGLPITQDMLSHVKKKEKELTSREARVCFSICLSVRPSVRPSVCLSV